MVKENLEKSVQIAATHCNPATTELLDRKPDGL